eukprot:jgi/Chlat1/8128/Chrsp75S07560
MTKGVGAGGGGGVVADDEGGGGFGMVASGEPGANPVEKTELQDYDSVLEMVGNGRFQRKMLWICGLGNAADAVEILTVSFILPGAQSDLHLSYSDMGWLTASIFFGMLIGSWIWGFVSDLLGRRYGFACAMGVAGVFALASAFSFNVTTLVLLRACAGVGVGGSVPVVFSYFAEFLSSDIRGTYMVLLASFWMVGSLYAAITGWAIIPWIGWRYFVAWSSLPAFICAASILLSAPESPRYLMVKRRPAEAMEILRGAAVENGIALPSGLALAPLEHSEEDAELARSTEQGFEYWWLAVMSRIKAMMQPHVKRMLMVQMVLWFGISFGWYSTALWLPEYFQRRSGSTEVSMSVYFDTLLTAVAQLPGNIISLRLVDSIGRRWTLAGCMMAGGVSAILFAAAPSGQVWSVAAGCLFNGVSIGGWNALDLYSAESFPTSVRTSAMGVLLSAGRIGSICASIMNGKLLEMSIWLPLLAASAAMFMASFAAIFALPVETKSRTMVDTIKHFEGSSSHNYAARRSSPSGTAGGVDEETALLP